MNVIEANLPVTMCRDHWNNLPDYELPPKYFLRLYRPGDAVNWVRILRTAYGDETITTELFTNRFDNNERELARRQYFLCDDFGMAIGTATAWWDETFEDGKWGRIRAVAIDPSFQGRRLTRPLLSTLCRRFQELGDQRAFLTTSTKRLPAIKLYRRFGFKPHLQSREDRLLWRELEKYF